MSIKVENLSLIKIVFGPIGIESKLRQKGNIWSISRKIAHTMEDQSEKKRELRR
jgi:hypothetical protein